MTPPASFKERVLQVVGAIPAGRVLTYKDVATKAGSPRAFRAVGTIMRYNYNPAIPCHRVIKSNGELGSYNRGGTAVKRQKLRAEGYNAKEWSPLE